TPEENDLEGLKRFYDDIEHSITHCIAKLRLLETENPEKAEKAKIEFMKAWLGAASHCGPRQETTSIEEFSAIVHEIPATFENGIFKILADLRTITLEGMVVQDDESTLYSNRLFKLFGEEFGIPTAKARSKSPDHFPDVGEEVHEENARARFYANYTPHAILKALAMELRMNSDLRDKGAQWCKEQIFSSWNKKEFEEISNQVGLRQKNGEELSAILKWLSGKGIEIDLPKEAEGSGDVINQSIIQAIENKRIEQFEEALFREVETVSKITSKKENERIGNKVARLAQEGKSFKSILQVLSLLDHLEFNVTSSSSEEEIKKEIEERVANKTLQTKIIRFELHPAIIESMLQHLGVLSPNTLEPTLSLSSQEKQKRLEITKELHTPFVNRLKEIIYTTSQLPKSGEAGNPEMDAILYQVLIEDQKRDDVLIVSFNESALQVPTTIPSHIRYIVSGCYVKNEHAVALVIDREKSTCHYFDPLHGSKYKSDIMPYFEPLLKDLGKPQYPRALQGTLQDDKKEAGKPESWSCIFHAIENIVSTVKESRHYGFVVDGNLLEKRYGPYFTEFAKMHGGGEKEVKKEAVAEEDKGKGEKTAD
ncbi:MAG: hypothetical protein JWO53_1071, partial [Chlamydiia bacterium]|nr:hypothetical protein [Chlamydiia bacterium]